jgi:hypothetical protein
VNLPTTTTTRKQSLGAHKQHSIHLIKSTLLREKINFSRKSNFARNSKNLNKTFREMFSSQFSFDRPENRKNSTEKGLKKNKGKGERRGETKNSARPSRTHNNNTLSSAHATAGTLQGRRRTRHTHTQVLFLFFIFISWIFSFFFLLLLCCAVETPPIPARARIVGWTMGGVVWSSLLPFAGVFGGSDRIARPHSQFFFVLLLFIH